MLTYLTTVESACEKLGIEVRWLPDLGVGFVTGYVMDCPARLSEHYWIDFASHVYWDFGVTNSTVTNSTVWGSGVFSVRIYRRE